MDEAPKGYVKQKPRKKSQHRGSSALVPNRHIFFIVLPSLAMRVHVTAESKKKGIAAFFHYVPLHSAPAGLKFGRAGSDMIVTDAVFTRLLRLPVWVGLGSEDLAHR